MKNLKLLTVIIVAVIAIGGASFFGVITGHQRQLDAQAKIYDALITKVDEFHERINDLTVSSSNKDTLTNEVSKVCRLAEETSKNVCDLKPSVLTIRGDTLALQDAVEKADKYVSGFPDYIHGLLAQERLVQRAEVMLDCLDNSRMILNRTSTIDKSDTGTTIDRVTMLVLNLKDANQKASLEKSNSPRIVVVPSPYWENPTYTDYRDSIRQIVASYAAGRKVLSRVLDHYDRGVFGSQDRADWQAEMNRRQGLIGRLQSIESDIPPGSIYREHHLLLKRMLNDAVEAMENFAAREDSSSRQYLSIVSQRNSTIMNRLKAFYGIR